MDSTQPADCPWLSTSTGHLYSMFELERWWDKAPRHLSLNGTFRRAPSGISCRSHKHTFNCHSELMGATVCRPQCCLILHVWHYKCCWLMSSLQEGLNKLSIFGIVDMDVQAAFVIQFNPFKVTKTEPNLMVHCWKLRIGFMELPSSVTLLRSHTAT